MNFLTVLIPIRATNLFLILLIFSLSGCAVTPKPFSQQEAEAKGKERLENFTRDQEAIKGPISVYEAMARALKHNLDFKLELMSIAMKTQEAKVLRYDMLPTVVANLHYRDRNNYSGASSSRLLGSKEIGEQSLVASTSSERRYQEESVEIAWDALDFGLSYIRSQQKADEILLAEERKRAIVNRIIEDVRTAYWRAASAERLIDELGNLKSEISQAFESSQKIYTRRQTVPLSALNFQRELLQINEKIQDLQSELIIAKYQLAALMNISPHTNFRLLLPDRKASMVELDFTPDQLVDNALRYRPELREVDYRQRINAKEANVALLEIFPSLRLYGGINYNDNQFVFNNRWRAWGVDASWNLLQAFRYPAKKRFVESLGKELEARELAVTMAVVTQVHTSYVRYLHAQQVLNNNKQYFEVQKKILHLVDSSAKAKSESLQTLLREKMNMLLASARYDVAFADLQNTYANIFASMGVDPYGEDININEETDVLSDRLKNYWEHLGNKVVVISGS